MSIDWLLLGQNILANLPFTFTDSIIRKQLWTFERSSFKMRIVGCNKLQVTKCETLECLQVYMVAALRLKYEREYHLAPLIMISYT